MHFAHSLTHRAYSLYLPKEARNGVTHLVSKQQASRTNPKMAPFRRNVDFWLFCLGVALAEGLAPREGSPKDWGYKFVDTREVQLPNEVYKLLTVVAYEELARDADLVEDPAQIINVANRLAGAAYPRVLNELMSKDLRNTPLDKALGLARHVLS